MKYLLSIFLAVSLLTSCTKNAGNGQGPVINITSPAANQVFTSGQTITVTASITHSSQIHEVKVRVRDNATGDEILEFKTDVNNSSYTLSKSFIARGGIVYKIEVEASDYSGYETEKEFTVSVI